MEFLNYHHLRYFRVATKEGGLTRAAEKLHVFHLPQPVQASCTEGKVIDLLAQLAAYRLEIVLSDEPVPASSDLEAFNHLLGECGNSFCAEPKLAARLKRNFPASLHEAPALLPGANSALRRSQAKTLDTRRALPILTTFSRLVASDPSVSESGNGRTTR